MKFLFLTLSIFILVSSNAQYSTDTLYRKYTNGLIYRLGGSIIKGNERITFQELSKEFSMSELGKDQYNLAKRKRTTSLILRLISTGCGIGALSLINNNRDLSIGLLAGQFVTLFGSSSVQQASQRNLDQAIWIRNKDYLFPAGR